MITPKFKPVEAGIIKEGMKLLVTGVPSLHAFKDNKHSRNAWEKLFLGKLVEIVDMQYCKEGLIGVCLASARMTSTNYVQESCLLDIGIRD